MEPLACVAAMSAGIAGPDAGSELPLVAPPARAQRRCPLAMKRVPLRGELPAAYVGSALCKWDEDRQRLRRVAGGRCSWQNPAEPRAVNTKERVARDKDRSLHWSREGMPELLRGVALQLGTGASVLDGEIQLQRLSAPRVAGVCTTEVHVVAAGSEDGELGGEAAGERAPSNVGVRLMVLKLGSKDLLLEEARHHAWASRILGPRRVPQVLCTEPVAHAGLAAYPTEFVGFAGRVGPRLLSTLGDFLLLGTCRFALDDLRAAWQALPEGDWDPGSLPLSPHLPTPALLAATPPHASDVRCVAQQLGDMLAALAKQQPPPLLPQAGGHVGGDEATQALLGLIPLLERHLMVPRHATCSPLHPSVRKLTEQHYAEFYGGDMSGLLANALRLKERLVEMKRAASTGSSGPRLPRISVPVVWSHGRLSASHVLLRGSGRGESAGAMLDHLGQDAEAKPWSLEACVTSWRSLAGAPLYWDLATLLTSAVFETIRLPTLLDCLADSYAAHAGAGAAAATATCASHFGISEGTATRLLSLCGERARRLAHPSLGLRCKAAAGSARASSALRGLAAEAAAPGLLAQHQEVAAMVGEAVEGCPGEAPDFEAERDAARLLAWVRLDRGALAAAAVEARRISAAICDWRPPAGRVHRARAGAARAPRSGPGRPSSACAGSRPRSVGVPRPKALPCTRPRGAQPVRALQWGWRAVRDLCDDCAGGLPCVEGDFEEVWPALWLLPGLRQSLEMLDAPSCPWPQKVWLLYHVGCLVEGVTLWLDDIASSESLSLRVRPSGGELHPVASPTKR